ncbi:MAG: hypothetical protein AAGF81_15650 [Pseudomonadota bacterium]
MSIQIGLKAGKIGVSVFFIGLLVVAGGCAKTKTQPLAPPPVASGADTGIITGSVQPIAQANQPAVAKANPGTVSGVKTASIGTSRTAVATRTARNKITLAFPKKGYALSGAQSEQLAGFVRDAKKQKKRVKVIGIATAKQGSKSKRQQAREEASRRAKATSMFLRVYGLTDNDMTITTADQRPKKGLSTRRVEVVLQ